MLGWGGAKKSKKKESLILEDINPVTTVYCEDISECHGCHCENTVAYMKTEVEVAEEQPVLDGAHMKHLFQMMYAYVS